MEKPTEQIPLNQEVAEVDIESQELQVEDLDFWTLSFLREHIDMPEGIDFDPDEELQQIKKLIAESPKEEQSTQRLFLMTSFKRKIKVLRENMAQAQLELERFILENQELSKEEFLRAVEEIAERNNVSAQARHLQNAVVKYFENHVNITDTVQVYKKLYFDTWQAKLFEDLFGQPPRGQIEIETMPINIYIKISNIEDYVIAHGASGNIARNSGGGALLREFPKVRTLSNKVLIENSSLVSPTYSEETVKPHEEEHSIHNNIYPRSTFVKGEQEWLSDLGRNREIELPLLNTVINKSITNIFASWLFGAKTEILAFMKNGEDIGDIKQLLTDPDDLYNYVNDKEIYQDWFLNHLKKAKIKVAGADKNCLTEAEIRTMYADALERAWHKRYLPMLKKIFQALDTILSFYGPDKYPKIMRLLSQEPINKWPRLAKILS